MATDKEGLSERINATSRVKPIIVSGPDTGKLQWTVTILLSRRTPYQV
jgi:hypothetical protein